MAASRALFLIASLCAFQVSQASLLPTWDSLETTVDTLKDKTYATINSTLQSITSKVSNVTSGLESNLAIEIASSTSEVAKLVAEAEADGVAAGSCGITAASNLTSISIAFPISLTHCYTDYLDAFNYYVMNIEKDFSDIYQALTYGMSQASECSLLDVACDWNAFYNATSTEVMKASDIAFQVTDSFTAAGNLVATITKCDEEKSTQALLDVAKVTPETITCISQIKAESSGSSSS